VPFARCPRAAHVVVVAGLLLAGAPLHSQRAPKSAGFSRPRLARIDTLLADAVQREEIAGAVALVLRDDAVVYEHAAGWRDREAKTRMTTDAIFRIASQSKALTSVATLMLMEEGKFTPATPVSRYLPTFARTMVATRGDTSTVVPTRRQITLRDLLTHTAGVSYGTDAHVASRYRAKGLGPAAGIGWYTADKSEPICATMDTLGTLPFVAQPGEAWVYGYNTDVLGCVVERASGMPLDQFLRTRITGPLGMKDTHFFLPPADRARLVTVYASQNGKTVRAPDGPRGQGDYVDGPRVSFAGGAGLVSTARDYARFLQMLAHGGVWAGRRYLAPHTVALMTTNQVGTLHGAQLGFGFGFETVEAYGAAGMSSVGTWGWGGAYGSNYKVDPTEGLVMVVMINQLPNSSDIVTKVQQLVYAALEDSRKR
jgi:CubicO group peptidase (beta-lactamase class C family)